MYITPKEMKALVAVALAAQLVKNEDDACPQVPTCASPGLGKAVNVLGVLVKDCENLGIIKPSSRRIRL